MEKWREEIDELHEVFEAYFLGTLDTLDRVEAALSAGFSIVGPTGIESGRAATIEALVAGHAHTNSLQISITEPRLLHESQTTVVARYIENHQLKDRTNHRLSTVVFSQDTNAPNGLLWQRVHETWIDPPAAC